MTELADRMERRAEEWGNVPKGAIADDVRAARAAHRKAWREAAEMARLYEARK